MKASFFPIKNRKLISEFAKINDKIQIVIINGKNVKEKNNMDKVIKKARLKHHVVNLGFTDKIVEYFSTADLILGKGGGLSLTETINSKLPSLIVNKLPQQEIYNREYMIKNGASIGINKNEIALKINELLSSPNKLKEMKENAEKISISNTLQIIYDTLKDVPKAKYDNLICVDNKRDVIKKVHNARKKSIKSIK